MSVLRRLIATALIGLTGFAAPGFSRIDGQKIQEEVDAVIVQAYESASQQFPCRIRTGGKNRMLRRADLDRCLNYANNRVDWDSLSKSIQEIRLRHGLQEFDMIDMVETSLSRHAIPYNRILDIRDERALVPLSNSLLKFLPEGSFDDMPVYSREGELLGTFSGIYSFEKRGGLSSAESFQMKYFQYTDFKGNIHTPAERFLLDSYAVPWKEAMYKPGFRLPSNQIMPTR
ncbi:MAG TPA: hypothetical protein VLL97_07380 [Acidobacteriota bacterium]|nr:hypothetical protein [Acidobacteriota bacterium]